MIQSVRIEVVHFHCELLNFFVYFWCNDEQEEPKEESDDDMGFSLFD